LLITLFSLLIAGSVLISHHDSFIQLNPDFITSHHYENGQIVCSCDRKTIDISKLDLENATLYNKTTCSPEAYARGNGQKIIGFSYYGDFHSAGHKAKKYFEGIQNNVNLLPKFYPGWIIRLYYDLDQDDPLRHQLCELSCQTNFDLCDIQKLPGRVPMGNVKYTHLNIELKAKNIFPRNWRFFPILDPQVDAYLSRDLDSEFTEREIAAVSEWMESDKSFHMMRDHPQHDAKILGGAWGVKLTKEEVRLKWRNAWKKALQNGDGPMWKPRNINDADQDFLNKYVWLWAKWDAVQHDSYFCKKFSRTRPFPTRRKNETNNFIGSVINENYGILEKCPEKCRPKEHQDWEYC